MNSICLVYVVSLGILSVRRKQVEAECLQSANRYENNGTSLSLSFSLFPGRLGNFLKYVSALWFVEE